MHPSQDSERRTVIETLRSTVLILCFGLTLLAFLIAIDRPQWFVLRPASGTAAAMAKASQDPSSHQQSRSSDSSPSATENR